MSDTSRVSVASAGKNSKKPADHMPRSAEEHASSAHYVPLAFALIPPLGALFHGRSETWTDGMILLLVAFYLYQLHRVPWVLYYEARQQRPLDEPDADLPHAERQRLRAAQTELRRYEILALLSTVAAPLLGAGVLYAIRSCLSEPERFINTFNVRLYVMASGIKPWLHLSRLIRGRVHYLEDVARHTKTASGSTLDRIAAVEKDILSLRQLSATKADVRTLRDGLDAPLAHLYKNLRKAERKEELMLLTFGERFSLLDAKVDRALGTISDDDIGSPRPTRLLLSSENGGRGSREVSRKTTQAMTVFSPLRLVWASLWWVKRWSVGGP